MLVYQAVQAEARKGIVEADMCETRALTEAEKRKQIEENLSQNVFVEAGAGAGKTTLIVNRIVNQLKKGMPPERIVVITFTNAAAEELRSRITKKVREACREQGISEAESHALQGALQQLDLMKMSTIHSFCFTLLQERSFDARLPMDAQLLEETQALQQRGRIFTEWASGLSAADWQILAKCGSKYEVIRDIRSFFNDICELPADTDIYCDRSLLGRDFYGEAKLLVEDFLKVFLAKATVLWAKTYTKAEEIPASGLTAEAKKMQKLLQEKEIPYFEILKIIAAKTKNKKKYFNLKKTELAEGAQLEAEDAGCRAWFEQTNKTTVESLLAQYEDYRYTQLLVYVIEARKYYRAKRPLGNLTNDDLLQKTHRLICESRDARKYFADKISCLYVDEFQDTDHIQEEFIWKLCVKEDSDALRDGALFLVGDPKQSIYRFRGAEPEVYFTAKEKMQKQDNGAVYCLDNNYRSNEKIIFWVNENFKERDISGEPYRSMAFQKQLPDDTEDALAGVYYYSCAKGKAAERETDSVNLAKLIEKLVGNGCRIVDYAEGVPYLRKVEYADFLVLCYSKKDMDMYLREMQERGIPVQINGSILLTANAAITNFVRIFDFLTHPYDKAKRLGAAEALRENGTGDTEGILYALKEQIKGMSAFGAAEYLAAHPEYLLPLNVPVSREQMRSVQTKLEQMLGKVFAMENTGGESLADKFWKYRETELERELSLEENAQAVRFMNLHKAKGLEGNIVILAKRDENMKFHEGAFRKGKMYYPALSGAFGKTMWASYRSLSDVFTAAEHEEAREQTRLQYVAATRAKQVFITMDAITEGCMFFAYSFKQEVGADSILPILDNLPEISRELPVIADYQMPQTKVVPKTDEDGSAQDRVIFVKATPSALEGVSATREAARKRMQEERKCVQDGQCGKPGQRVCATQTCDGLKAVKRPKGDVFGTAMHRGLELFIERWRTDFDASWDVCEKWIRISVTHAILEGSCRIPEAEREEYRSFLTEILEAFARWAYDKRLFTDDSVAEVHTEYPFSFYEEQMELKGEVGPVWMNGTADLMIRYQDGSIAILDYKSDRDDYLTEEEFEISLQERYAGQLQMYRYAVARLHGISQEQVSLGILSFTEKTGSLQVRHSEM